LRFPPFFHSYSSLTQSASHATPTDYASDNIQTKAQGTVEETAHHLPTPRRISHAWQGASDNWNRAKWHFQEVRRHLPKNRQHASSQAQKTAICGGNADSNTIITATQ